MVSAHGGGEGEMEEDVCAQCGSCLTSVLNVQGRSRMNDGMVRWLVPYDLVCKGKANKNKHQSKKTRKESHHLEDK